MSEPERAIKPRVLKVGNTKTYDWSKCFGQRTDEWSKKRLLCGVTASELPVLFNVGYVSLIVLVGEKSLRVPPAEHSSFLKRALLHGVVNELPALEEFQCIMKTLSEVAGQQKKPRLSTDCGLFTTLFSNHIPDRCSHTLFDLGASPDGLLLDDNGDIEATVEIKCPINRGKWHLVAPESKWIFQSLAQMLVVGCEVGYIMMYIPTMGSKLWKIELGGDHSIRHYIRTLCEAFTNMVVAVRDMPRSQNVTSKIEIFKRSMSGCILSVETLIDRCLLEAKDVKKVPPPKRERFTISYLGSFPQMVNKYGLSEKKSNK